MTALKHELWAENEEEETFCLAGSRGAEARARLSPNARLVWTVWAGSHSEAMTEYYAHRGWGVYSTEHAWDREPYPEKWAEEQRQEGAG